MFVKRIFISALFLVSFKFQIMQKCQSQNQYFDYNQFTCRQCPINSIQYSNTCICDENSIQEYGIFDFKNGCIKCPDGQVNNQKINKCMKQNTADCNKPNQFKQDLDSSGEIQDQIQCITCSKGFVADKINQMCIKMDEGQFYDNEGILQCIDGYIMYKDSCFQQNLYESLNDKFSFEQVSFVNQNQDGYNQLTKSIYLSENILFESLNCLQNKNNLSKQYCEKIYTYCQAQDFNEQIQVCQLYNYIQQNYPKKEYQGSLYTQITAFELQQEIEFFQTHDKKEIIYVFDFQNYQKPKKLLQFQNHLTICNVESKIYTNMNDTKQCTKSLYQISQLRYQNLSFYFIDTNNNLHLIPIIFLQSYEEFRLSFDKLVQKQKRSKLSLTESQIFSKNSQQMITFIQKSQLRVTRSQNGEFFLTILVLQKNQTILEDQDVLQKITFDIVFDAINSKFTKVIKYTFGFLHFVIFIVWIFSCFIWNKQHPEINYGDNWFFYILVNWFWSLLKTWSVTTLIYILFLACFQLIFYHLSLIQVFWILNNNLYRQYYISMKVVLLISSIILFVDIFLKIRIISKSEVILIDWERKKIEVELQNDLIEEEDKKQSQNKKKIKSAWRSLLVANEYHELSIERRYRLELVFSIFLFAMQSDYFQKLQIESISNKLADKNEILILATNFICFFVIFIFYSIVLLFYENLRGDIVADFLDLITISNISIICFDSQVHGYYLHGQNNTGSSEGDFLEFKKNLKKEERGYLGKRGLIEFDKNELQTFEVFIPYNFRIFLDSVFHQELKTQLQQKQYQGSYYQQDFRKQNLFDKSNQNFFNLLPQNMNPHQSKFQRQLIQESLPLDLNYKKIFEKHLIVVKAFKKVLHNIKQNKDICLEKTLLHQIFGYPKIKQSILQNQTVFYKDQQEGFRNLMFIGQESTILFFEMAIFLCLNVFIKNEILTTLLVYLIDYFRHELLIFLTKKNFSRSSLINEAFLNQLINDINPQSKIKRIFLYPKKQS